MRFEDFDLNIESILDYSEKEELHFVERLATYSREINAKTIEAVNKYLAQEKEYGEKCEAVKTEITQLHSRKKEIIAELDDMTLKKKLANKKIAITMNQHAKLHKEIEEEKARKESISLEMVDLMQELEDGKRKKRDLWNAIKRACAVYKENLNYHIDFTSREDHECVKVTFFKRNNSDLNNYYVNLLNYTNSWKVDQIEPPLKDIHMEEIKTIVDIKKPLDDLDVIIFLCELRHIFSKHYRKQ